MAEFAEVMKQARRLCKAHDLCGTCQLYDYCDQFNDTRGGQWDVDAAAFERTVMDWAEEHPEPEYPTWYTWLANMNVVPIELPLDQAVMVTDIGLLNEIPADIAEKLGIPPIKER